MLMLQITYLWYFLQQHSNQRISIQSKNIFWHVQQHVDKPEGGRET